MPDKPARYTPNGPVAAWFRAPLPVGDAVYGDKPLREPAPRVLFDPATGRVQPFPVADSWSDCG